MLPVISQGFKLHVSRAVVVHIADDGTNRKKKFSAVWQHSLCVRWIFLLFVSGDTEAEHHSPAASIAEVPADPSSMQKL